MRDQRARTLFDLGYFGDVLATRNTQQKYARTGEYSGTARNFLDEKVIRKWDITRAVDSISRESGFLQEYLDFLGVYILKSAGATHGAKAIRTQFKRLVGDIKGGSFLTEIFFRRARNVLADRMPFESYDKAKFVNANNEFLERYQDLYSQVTQALYPQSYTQRAAPPVPAQGTAASGQQKL